MTEVERFLDAAERYCGLIDSLDRLSRYEFVSAVNLILPELYRAAIDLPDRFIDGPEPPDVDQSPDLFHVIQAKLADRDGYRGVIDPWDRSEEAVDPSLADDLAGIYHDLQIVRTDDRGDAGVWDWRWRFVYHWGAHAAQALLATHWLLYPAGEGWLDPSERPVEDNEGEGPEGTK